MATAIYDVIEKNVIVTGTYTNPQSVVSVVVTATPPAGSTQSAKTLGGFYYGTSGASDSLFKFRFAANEVGTWNFSAAIVANGTSQTTQTSSESVTANSANKGFIVRKNDYVSGGDPKAWVYSSDGSPFNPVGCTDAVFPRPGGLTTEPFMLGADTGVAVTGEGANQKFLPLIDYMALYGNGKMNIFRWSIGQPNHSMNQYTTLNDTGFVPATAMNLKYDEVPPAVRSNGMRLMLGFFHDQLSNVYTAPGSAYRANQEKYVKYIIDRWGAYVDFWEIGNEANGTATTGINDEYVNSMKAFIRANDPYGHPISHSFQYEADNIYLRDISGLEYNLPHSYYTVDPLVQASTTVSKVASSIALGKQVILGETGNLDFNYSADSDRRARIQAWTLFFNKVGVMWFNFTQDAAYTSTVAANLYIGAVMRGYIDKLTDYTDGFPAGTLSTPAVSGTGTAAASCYAMSSNKTFGAYLIGTGSHTVAKTGSQITVNIPFAGTAVWTDPATGSVVGSSVSVPSSQNTVLTAPSYDIDIALKITESATSPDTTAPTPPGTPTFSNVTQTAMRVSWAASTDVGGGITGYDLQRSLSASFTSPTTFNLGNVLFYDATGLTADLIYYWRVRAHDAIPNNSAYSNGSPQKTETALPVLYQIDCGRTTGGTIAGWAQDSNFSGGGLPGSTTLPIGTSNLTTAVPPDSVLKAYRYDGVYSSGNLQDGTPFTYTFTGLTNTAHTVRLWMLTNSGGSPANHQTDITINSVLVADNYANPSDLNAYQLEYSVTPTNGTITVNIANVLPAGANESYSLLSALKIFGQTPPADTTPPTISITAPAETATVSGSGLLTGYTLTNPVTQKTIDGSTAELTDLIYVAMTAAADLSTANTLSGYTLTNPTALRTLDVNTAELEDAINFLMTIVSDRQAGLALTGYTISNFVQLKTLDGLTAELEDAIRFITTIATDLSAAVNLTCTAADNVGVVSVQWKVGGVNFGAAITSAPFSKPFNTTSFSNGSYSITAVATDAAGNSTTSAARSVTVSNATPDTTPPSISITAPTSGATISGATVSLTCNASDNIGVTSVQWKVDGVNSGAPVTTSPFSKTLDTTSLSNGTHSITAVATDAAGNSTTSAARSVTVSNAATGDTTNPVVSTFVAAAFSQSQINLSYVATDNVGVTGYDLEWSPNGSTGWTFLINNTLPSSPFQHTGRTPSTIYYYRFRARDAAGLVSPYSTANATTNAATNTTPPAPTNPVTNDTANTFGFTLASGYVLADHEYSLNSGATYSPVTANPIPVGDNNYSVGQVVVRVKAAAGRNAGLTLANAVAFTATTAPPADTTPPTISITAPASGATVSGTAVNLTCSASDNVGVASVQWKLNGTNSGAAVTVTPFSKILDTTTLANGSYSITAVATDAAGNTTTSAARSVTVSNAAPDTTPPTISITAPTSGATISGAAVSLTCAAADNSGVVASVQWKLNGTNSGAAITISPFSKILDTTTLTNGSYSITAVATDGAGNSTTSAAVQVTVTGSIAAPRNPYIEPLVVRERYYEYPPDWDAVTGEHTYQDGGKGFNELSDSPLLKWELIYTGLSPVEAKVFDTHFLYCRKSRTFEFLSKDGQTHPAVYYSEFERSHNRNMSQIQTRRVVLVEYPSTTNNPFLISETGELLLEG